MCCYIFVIELLVCLIIYVKNIYLLCKKIVDKVNFILDFLV